MIPQRLGLINKDNVKKKKRKKRKKERKIKDISKKYHEESNERP